MKPTTVEIRARFLYHKAPAGAVEPVGDQIRRTATARALVGDLAAALVELTPSGPEQARMLDALTDALTHTEAAIVSE